MAKILCPEIIRYRALLEFQSPVVSQGGPDLEEFLCDLMGVLGLTPLTEVTVKEGTAHGGKSAMVIFEESGAMVHTFQPENFVTVYIDSCTKFRIKDLKDVVRYYFRCKRIRHTIIKPLE